VGGPNPDTVGGGGSNDFAAQVSGLILTAEGSFISVTPGIGETGNTYGPPNCSPIATNVANAFTLQLNTNTFPISSTSVCSGPIQNWVKCGWQQFVFDNNATQAYIQYWLENYGTTGTACPAGWFSYPSPSNPNEVDCYTNSDIGIGIPSQTMADLSKITMTATAESGATDTLLLGTASGDLTALGSDSLLNLAQRWHAAEFNIFGDGCSSQANFSNGSTIVVKTSVDDRSLETPKCVAESFTGETDNLTLVPPCCPYAGASPNIQFMESNAAFPTATCGSSGLQAFTSLHSFSFSDGEYPNGLVQATNGDLYGTTNFGAEYAGTVYKITPSGTLTTVYSFCSQSNCTDGDGPLAGLVQATNGDLYGTTGNGGANGGGTVFKITPSGTLTTLYSFCYYGNLCPDGSYPVAGLIQATNGDLYGTTYWGGANGKYNGTVFKITPSGTLTTLYRFCSQGGCTDGSEPAAGLVQAANGNLYGTTEEGGANNAGTVFKITPSGTLTTLYSFCSQSGCTDGESPKCGGDGQSTPLGQPFAAALQVCVTDAAGNPIPGWPVSFRVTPGTNGAGGAFNSSPPMPALTNASGSAAAPALTANGIAGTFTVTASAGALSVTFTLTNLAYTLGDSSATVASTAGSGSLLLLAGGPWTAGSNAAWLQVSGSSSGAGNASIQFAYAANPNVASRNGMLTISGLTFTITQAGANYIPVPLVEKMVSTGLKSPRAVAVDTAGNVYFADTSNNAIKEWSAATQQVSVLVSSGLNVPTGVAVDAQGNVYIADSKNNAIKEWSAVTGEVTPLVSSGLSSPIGVAVDTQGNVYFSDAGHNMIKEWVAATHQVAELVSSGLDHPEGVAVDVQGNIYFADTSNDAIKERSAGGQVSTLVSTGLNLPVGIAVDGDGNVYFADTGNGAIKEWSPADGQATVLLSSGLKSPEGVAVDGQGNVYIADTSNNALKRFSTVYLALGATSRTETSSAGTDSIPVQVIPASAPLTATCSQSWLTIGGTSGGAISFSFLANTSTNSRTAQIDVMGQSAAITQSGDTPAAIAETSGNGQTAIARHSFASRLEVRVTDAAGQDIKGANVTFTVLPGSNGASGTFASSPPMPVATNASGSATAPALTANGVAGTFEVLASAGGATATFTFTLTITK
jgi:uncharacterized repeat protein (TIGR03803 family)